jgi:hypothetical protein
VSTQANHPINSLFWRLNKKNTKNNSDAQKNMKSVFLVFRRLGVGVGPIGSDTLRASGKNTKSYFLS